MSIAADILTRVVQMVKLDHSVRQHLHHEQQDATAATAASLDPGRTCNIADPTATAARALAPYAHTRRRLDAALNSINKALNDAEAEYQRALSGKHDTSAEPRCPGWSPQRRNRLGGCGNIPETYRLANGQTVTKSHGLCTSCRRERDRTERNAA